MTERLALFGLSPVKEVFLLWGASFLCIILSFLILPSQSSVVATVCFLYLPWIFMSRRNEDYRDYGLSMANLKPNLLVAGLVIALIVPLFFLGFLFFMRLLSHVPPSWTRVITPLQSRPVFHPRLPQPPLAFAWQVVGQTFVVALPEEFFFRGYMLSRLKDAWPPHRKVLGVPIGRAFFVTAALFALGHLAIFQAWRLWVFFPALLFGWLKERTGSLVAPTAVHAFCNLYEQFLEASFQG
jgi:membrane protease YdiL (CAAX protease family)